MEMVEEIGYVPTHVQIQSHQRIFMFLLKIINCVLIIMPMQLKDQENVALGVQMI